MSIRTANRYLDFNSWLAMIGFASYWAWIDSVFFSTNLFGSMSDAVALSRQSQVIAQTIATLITILVVIGARRIEKSPRASLAMGLVSFLGVLSTTVVLWSATHSNTILFVASSCFLGIPMGLVPLLWGLRYTDDNQNRSAVWVAGSLVLSGIMSLTISQFETPGTLLGICILLPAGLLCFTTLAQLAPAEEMTETPSQFLSIRQTRIFSPDNPPQSDNALHLFWRLLLVLFVCSFAFGTMQASHFLMYPNEYGSLSNFQMLGRSGFALLVFAVTGFLNKSFKDIYRIGLLLMIAAFLAYPLFDRQNPLIGSLLINCGYTCIDLMMWTLSFEIIRVLHMSKLQTFGIFRTLMMVGVLVGVGCNFLLAPTFIKDPVQLTATLTAVAYLLVITLTLLIDERNPFGFWQLMDRKAARHFERDLNEKCKLIAQAHDLTSREHEILMYLALGRSAPFIAKDLTIALSTAKFHIGNIYSKLGIHSKQELIDYVNSQ